MILKSDINYLFIMQFPWAVKLFTVKRYDLIDRNLRVFRKGLGSAAELTMFGARHNIKLRVRPLMDWTEEAQFTE
jgi:hypothetical protein